MSPEKGKNKWHIPSYIDFPKYHINHTDWYRGESTKTIHPLLTIWYNIILWHCLILYFKMALFGLKIIQICWFSLKLNYFIVLLILNEVILSDFWGLFIFELIRIFIRLMINCEGYESLWWWVSLLCLSLIVLSLLEENFLELSVQGLDFLLKGLLILS